MSSVDTSAGATIVFSPTKLTMSSAKGRMIILKPGGVWKWSYSSYFYCWGNRAANRSS
jgi:hypothetical protein